MQQPDQSAQDHTINRALLRLYAVFGMFDTAEAQPRRDHARHAEDTKKPPVVAN